MSSTRIVNQSNPVHARLHVGELRPAELQAIESTSLGVSLARAVDSITARTPIEPTVKLILKKQIERDTETSRRHLMLQKLVSLAGHSGHMPDLAARVEHRSQTCQAAAEQAVRDAFKVVMYAPNDPGETARSLRIKLYAGVRQHSEQAPLV